MSWFAHVLGIDDLSGAWYGWWSGAGSDLGEIAIVGALFAHYKRHTCHIDSPRFCWRPGVHPVTGTPFRVCGRHHPDVPDRVSAEHVASVSSVNGGDSP